MDLVTRFALVSLVCAFILNAVVTIQNFEKDRAITALGKELDSLRFQVKADRDLRTAKEAALATASALAETYAIQSTPSNQLVHATRSFSSVLDGFLSLCARLTPLPLTLPSPTLFEEPMDPC